MRYSKPCSLVPRVYVAEVTSHPRRTDRQTHTVHVKVLTVSCWTNYTHVHRIDVSYIKLVLPGPLWKKTAVRVSTVNTVFNHNCK